MALIRLAAAIWVTSDENIVGFYSHCATSLHEIDQVPDPHRRLPPHALLPHLGHPLPIDRVIRDLAHVDGPLLPRHDLQIDSLSQLIRQLDEERTRALVDADLGRAVPARRRDG